MSALVDHEILAAVSEGDIVVEPFDRSCLGTNSYDVHLGPVLRVYDPNGMSFAVVPREQRGDGHGVGVPVLDARTQNRTCDVRIPDDGIVLWPGQLYLASTVEYTVSRRHLPILNGKSSIGRLGLSIHVTAGTGDVGFRGHWTMELFVVQPLRVYAGMAVGQLLWFTAGVPEIPYDRKQSAKYNNRDPLPQASKLHLEGKGRG